jgi:hypothetical protein
MLDPTKPCPVSSAASCQAWECLYLLTKARRLRDAAATLHAKQSASSSTINTASSQAPAYVASRVAEGGLLPEVEVRGVQVQGVRKRGGTVEKLLLVREAVVRHVVEGLRGELVRDLMELGS